MSKLRNEIHSDNIPTHIGVIMDGNGRWAQKRSLPRSEGHVKGADVIEVLMDSALELDIKCVSLYAFSTENWSRPVDEVQFLWDLLYTFFEEKLPIMKEKGVRIYHSGSRKRLPSKVRKVLDKAISETEKNRGLKMNFCLNYGSRQEIVDGINQWSSNAKEGEKFTEKKMQKLLYASDLPDIDLLIRTSGEQRLSNFMLWQCAYAEFLFMNVLWPDFKPSHLYRAIIEFQKRKRRFGGI